MNLAEEKRYKPRESGRKEIITRVELRKYQKKDTKEKINKTKS